METGIALATLVLLLIGSLAGTLKFAFHVGANNTKMESSIDNLTGKLTEHQAANEIAHVHFHKKLEEHSDQITTNRTNITSLMRKGCAGS